MIALTIRGAMLRRSWGHLRELVLEPALADALPLFGLDPEALSEELALQLHSDIRGTAAEGLPEIEVVVRFPLDPPGVPTVEFAPDGLRCESCSALLGPRGGRWCGHHEPKCSCCGRPATDETPGDCPEHAAQLAALDLMERAA